MYGKRETAPICGMDIKTADNDSLSAVSVIRLGLEPPYFLSDTQSLINGRFLSPPISPCSNFFISQSLQLLSVCKGKKII